MGFWGRLFGGGETDEQKFANARLALDDGELERVARILMGIDGSAADELRQRARDAIEARDHQLASDNARVRKRERQEGDAAAEREAREPPEAAKQRKLGDPYRAPGQRTKPRATTGGSSAIDVGGMTIQFGADGSHIIGNGSDAVVLNAPKSDDDGKPRSRDGLAVGKTLVAELARSKQPLEQPAYSFVEAALLVARAGDKLPSCAHGGRNRLAQMCVAAAARDHEKVIAIAKADASVADYVVPLVLPFETAALAHLAHQDLRVFAALATSHPELAAAALARIAAEPPAPELGGFALAALDAGLDASAVFAKWTVIDDDPSSAEQAHPWRALAVRRIARTDLEAAVAAERALPSSWSHDDDASFAVASRLAQLDAARALAHARELGPDLDHAGWLEGCVVSAGQQAAPLVDQWIDAFTPQTYNPYFTFKLLVEASIELGDPARVERLCALAGPTGWQIAHAARWALAKAPARRELLDVLYRRYKPGFVSARAMDRGAMAFVVGNGVVRPGWLELDKPHPIETLSVVAALGADGPRWFANAGR